VKELDGRAFALQGWRVKLESQSAQKDDAKFAKPLAPPEGQKGPAK
jgi:hypothetical protein